MIGPVLYHQQSGPNDESVQSLLSSCKNSTGEMLKCLNRMWRYVAFFIFSFFSTLEPKQLHHSCAAASHSSAAPEFCTLLRLCFVRSLRCIAVGHGWTTFVTQLPVRSTATHLRAKVNVVRHFVGIYNWLWRAVDVITEFQGACGSIRRALPPFLMCCCI